MRKLLSVPVLALCLTGLVATGSAGAKLGAGKGRDFNSKTYPVCSPYVSESAAIFCKFNEMKFELSTSCSFTYRSGNCSGTASSGLFPWGTTGEGRRPYVLVSWSPSGNGDGRKLIVKSYGTTYGRVPAAELVGFVPGGGSANFNVSEAIAGNDAGFPSGDFFYTLNMPGRSAGQPGGPLGLNWQSRTARADVTISGYLYLIGR
jgi:hypothetical protein